MRKIAIVAAISLLTACPSESPPSAQAPDAAADAETLDTLTTTDTIGAPTAIRAADGSLAVSVVIPDGAGAGLVAARDDLEEALTTITAATPPSAPIPPSATAPSVVAVVDPGAAVLGDEGYRIAPVGYEGGPGLTVTARTDIGAMYGLYQIVADLGVAYIHPEETYFPSDPTASLPGGYDDTPTTPRFERRGFHEHTQHPIPASDFLLRTDDPSLRPFLTRYLRWLARNRQNVLFFHSLKTIDLDAWIPQMKEGIDAAHGLGIRVGTFISFADQQQNAFRLIDDTAKDPSGDPIPADEQIRTGLDRLLEAGFDEVGFQFGTSEFTKPKDTEALGWLDIAVAHLRAKHPGVRPEAWIHTTCTLEADDGGYYYHLPLKSDPDLGAFVHTTMFYTLADPAPVYGCDSFAQQEDFMAAASGARELTYFPESAWWLGFDDNMPLALPITGWSRAHDVREVLPKYEVTGHVTFTTGREWTYWQLDHFLTRLTFEQDISWEDYLRSLAPLYGAQGDAVAKALIDFTDLQRKHFYEQNPLIIFYLAGELPQDEIGAQAGILARRPKVAFKTVLEYSDAEFATWKATDYDMLATMLGQYEAALAPLPEALAEGSDQQRRLYHEARATLGVFVERIRHTLALYAGVMAARDGDEQAALVKLEEARAISTAVTATLSGMEAQYRYPVELLARPKPETLTAYPFGYLSDTSTGYFWSRRDDQLETLIEGAFGQAEEAWETKPDVLLTTAGETITMLEPESASAGAILSGFLPTMLFGTANLAWAPGTTALVVAQDTNENDLPDAGSEVLVTATTTGDVMEGTAEKYSIKALDNTGAELGDLPLVDPTFRLHLTGATPDTADTAEVEATVPSQALVEMVMNVGGIDEEGTKNLVKGVFGIDASEPLPDGLPIHVRFGVHQP